MIRLLHARKSTCGWLKPDVATYLTLLVQSDILPVPYAEKLSRREAQVRILLLSLPTAL